MQTVLWHKLVMHLHWCGFKTVGQINGQESVYFSVSFFEINQEHGGGDGKQLPNQIMSFKWSFFRAGTKWISTGANQMVGEKALLDSVVS